MVAVLLVVTVAMALPGAHALPFPADRTPASRILANPAQHPAGCHGYEPALPSPSSSSVPSPSPAPVSYECCVIGHHAAIPSAEFTIRSSVRSISLPRMAALSSLNGRDAAGVDVVYGAEAAASGDPSNSPPGASPLRI